MEEGPVALERGRERPLFVTVCKSLIHLTIEAERRSVVVVARGWMSSCYEALIPLHNLVISMKGNMSVHCRTHLPKFKEAPIALGLLPMSEVDGWEIDRGVD